MYYRCFIGVLKKNHNKLVYETYLSYMLYIVGNSCAEYNERGQRIQPNYKRKCNGVDFGVKCPFKYFANQSYLCE